MRPPTYIIAMIAGILALSSCAPKVYKSNVVTPPSPPKTESVTPDLKVINATSKELRTIVVEQDRMIESQKVDLEDAIAYADKIKLQLENNQPINQDDLENLKEKLEDAKARSDALKVENVALKLKINELENIVERATEKSNKKDGEVDQLRSNEKVLKEQVATLEQEKNAIADERDKLTKKLASASVYKNWVIGLVIGYVAWLIIKNIIMIYFPASAIRRF